MKPKNRKILEARMKTLRARLTGLPEGANDTRSEVNDELRAIEDAISGDSERQLLVATGQIAYLLAFELRHRGELQPGIFFEDLDRILNSLESALGRLGAPRPTKGVKRTAFKESTSLDPAWAGRESGG